MLTNKKFSMGKHLLLEVYEVEYDLLNDSETLEEVMLQGINDAGMSVLNVSKHCFVPQGCTIVITLAESHVSCHTWPEKGCIAADFYTCGPKNPHVIAENMINYLNSLDYNLREVER